MAGANEAPFRWMLYVAAYTALLGVPFLFFPNTVLPLLGFPRTTDPWIRTTGMFFLGITAKTISIYRRRTHEALLPSAYVRIAFTLVLTFLGLTGGYPGFLVLAGVVLFGALGTIWSVRRSELATPLPSRQQQ